MTYGTGEGESSNRKTEATAVSGMASSDGGVIARVTHPEQAEPLYHELVESTYATLNVYEYATLGPNDQMVTTLTYSIEGWQLIIFIDILFSIQGPYSGRVLLCLISKN